MVFRLEISFVCSLFLLLSDESPSVVVPPPAMKKWRLTATAQTAATPLTT